MPVEVKDRATLKHKCLRARKHPNGQPFGYCSTCSFVVVRFLNMWWHLDTEGADLDQSSGARLAKQAAVAIEGGEGQ